MEKSSSSKTIGQTIIKRELRGWQYWAVFGIAVAFSLFELYGISSRRLVAMNFRVIHIMFATTLIFCVFPFSRRSPQERITILDVVSVGLGIAGGVYLLMEYHKIVWRIGLPTFYDTLFGIIMTVVILEITRRTAGKTLPAIACGFILYTTVLGPYMPGILAHRNIDLSRMVSQLYLTLEGFYGMTTGVMVEYVFLFILFGAFLQKTRASNFFLNGAYAITGHRKGGPAQTAVIGSAMMGTISGSATANVVTTGTFTIPLMKKAGYKPETAAGIETTASVGGQLMPPLMGSGALIMSEFTGIPYVHIIAIATIPAILYYMSLASFVHFRAAKMGIEGLPKDKLPNLWDVLKGGFHLLIPFFVLVYMLIIGYTPQYAAMGGIFSLIAVSFLRKSSRMGVREFFGALALGARNAIMVSSILACVGIIIACMGLTGLGLKFSSMMLSVSGSTFLAVMLVMIASLILGMGLPITAAYIVLVILAGPALQQLGIPVIVAHMLVFWYSQDSAVTPPVCVTSYVAAGIAGANPVRTGLEAWKIAKALYVIPLLFVYTPLLTGNIYEMLSVAVFAAPGLLAMVSCFERYFFHKLNLVETSLMGIASFLLLFPNFMYRYIGLLLFGGTILLNYYQVWNRVGVGKELREVRLSKGEE